jgi:ribonuclease G
MMLAAWHKVNTFLENPKVPALVYREPNLLERTVRDFLTEDIDEIFIDNPEAFKTMKGLLTKFGGRKMAEKVKNYTNPRPIFEFYGIKHQIADIFKRVVPLPSGGYLCVDETEALVAIDVNTGKNRKSKDQPETILNTNLEAAEEVARQLRLRNVGGLVVIDFIDMRPQKDREKVFKLMKKLVKEDRAKSKMLPISKLGLMEMTRKREQESLQDAVYDPCPYCNGTGLVKSTMSMSVEIQRSLQQVLKAHSKEKDIEVRVIIHPAVLARLKNEDASILIEMEKNYGRNLSFRADKNIHHEEFKLVDPETGAEY